MTFFMVCLACVLSYLAYFENDKKLTPIERYGTLLFASFLSLVVDLVLGLILNQYYYFTKGIEWRDFIFHFGIYPAISCLFLNSFPFKQNIFIKLFYSLGWSILGIGYELFFREIGVFVYQKYHLWYSFLAYPFLFFTLLFNLKFINWLRRKSIPKNEVKEIR